MKYSQEQLNVTRKALGLPVVSPQTTTANLCRFGNLIARSRRDVLRRVERGEWDEADLRQMMDEYLGRPADRALFDLD